ncbi:MAG: flagellin FliC3 [Lachnospiraceae bacterium]|nr:flagellin FliC3 [Lachnospiraceae bacterium]
MRICYNVSAMIANNALNRNDDKLTQSLKRLSSGLKVVEAKDNPAGMAMGKRMNAQIKGISVATQNSSDAISVIETADGALAEVHSILQRMNELSIRASTGTLSDDDREKVQDEVEQLRDEIARIARDTQFNGETLLDGNFDLKGYTNMEDVKVGYYSDYVTTGTYGLTGLTVPLDEKGEIDGTGLIGTPVTGLGIGDAVGNGVVTAEMPADATITEVIGNKIKITSEENADFEINVKVYGDPNSTVAINNMQMDITGIGAMTMQIGANEGQTLDIRIPTISLEELNIKNIDMSTQVTAQESIDNIKSAILYVSEVRSRLGAYQNRLDHCISNLDIGSENMTAAYSRIMDVDMAEEMTEYTTRQVIAQSSMSMLAQANERPAQVLQLLQ